MFEFSIGAMAGAAAYHWALHCYPDKLFRLLDAAQRLKAWIVSSIKGEK